MTVFNPRQVELKISGVNASPFSEEAMIMSAEIGRTVRMFYRGAYFDFSLSRDQLDFFENPNSPKEKEIVVFRMAHPKSFERMKRAWDENKTMDILMRAY